MNKRLYYDNAYQTQFSANVTEILEVDNRTGVILDQTYFYPTSGGQPHDTGTINGKQVTEVFSRDSDSAIIHILDNPIEVGPASCEINWGRRFDHMQHHTGQHILTQAFVQVADANTIGFHLSQDSVTIDLNKEPLQLTGELIQEVEAVANQIIQENRVVTIEIVDSTKVESVRIRKIPENVTTDGLRVVDIQAFDQTACGGTHVSHTGEIGLIKILKIEKHGNGSRVEFRCGNRAIQDYSARLAITRDLSSTLTCHYAELPESIAKLQTELKSLQSTIKQKTSQLLEFEAKQLRETAINIADYKVITAVFEDRDRNELQILVSQLTLDENTLVFVGVANEKAHLIFGCNKDMERNMNPLLNHAFELLGGGRGGGRPNLVQGGGMSATLEQIESTLRSVVETLESHSS